jgi:uncharacterized protein involved in tolerance to divalent cations
MSNEKLSNEAQNPSLSKGVVSGSHYVKIFFTWFLFLDEKEIMQTGLEVSFRQFNGKPITYKFNGLKRIRSDNWVKKFIKTEITDLSNYKLKAIKKQSNYYVPTIIYAMSDDFR